MAQENTDRPRSWPQAAADLGSWLMDKWWHRLNSSGNDFQNSGPTDAQTGLPNRHGTCNPFGCQSTHEARGWV